MRKKLRRLVVGHKTYLWGYTIGYKQELLGNPPLSLARHAVFVAYQFGMKSSPLYLFVNWDDPFPEKALYPDVFLKIDEINAEDASLYVMPERAVKLIDAALKSGWQPEQSRTPFKRFVFLRPYDLVELGPPLPVL